MVKVNNVKFMELKNVGILDYFFEIIFEEIEIKIV